jgi:hypothetical protein
MKAATKLSRSVFDDYKKRQMQMTDKQIRIKLPAMRMLDTGEPADVQKLKTYVHEIFGVFCNGVAWDTTQYSMPTR